MKALSPVALVACCLASGLLDDTNLWSDQPSDGARKVARAAKASKWEKDMVEHLGAFRVLFKDDAVGAFVPELTQWQTGTLKGKAARIAQLEAALKDYPQSPFTGNTAILLARARFFNAAGDAAKAISDLYAVIKTYPDEVWIADDQPLREYIADSALERSADELTRLHRDERQAPNPSMLNSEVFPYLEYASLHPNRVADEAKIWIAWIIVHAPMERRYQEAEGLLRDIVAAHKDTKRTQADLDAAKQRKVALIGTVLPRPERTAHALLIDLLRKNGKSDMAAAEVAEYARLHRGHPSVERETK